MIVKELSDSTSAEVKRDTEEKKAGYARAGVREYFILDPSERHMHFHWLGAGGNYEEIAPDGEGVIRSHVLPGFQFRREHLLRLPATRSMGTVSSPLCMSLRPELKRRKNGPMLRRNASTPKRPPDARPKKRCRHCKPNWPVYVSDAPEFGSRKFGLRPLEETALIKQEECDSVFLLFCCQPTPPPVPPSPSAQKTWVRRRRKMSSNQRRRRPNSRLK